MAVRDDQNRGWKLAVVTAILDSSGRSVLMAQLGKYSKRYGDHPWVLPGGSVDPGESPSAAAVREVEEETGLQVATQDLRPIGWFGRPDMTPHDSDKAGELLILFGATANSRRPKVTPNPPEVLDAKWISVNLKRFEDGWHNKRYKGIVLSHHMYWARISQALMRIKQATPRFMIYDQNLISTKPWLKIERPQFEIDAFYT
ncbi:NUDIX hydrolase [Stieleria sp. ICT_E10.1]|nr:NUDIX hydrolase [Stieleria sedimenti]